MANTTTTVAGLDQITATLVTGIATLIAAVVQILISRANHALSHRNSETMIEAVKQVSSQRASSTSPTASTESLDTKK
jgi:hypothetical protein